jgi:hypothetical protein
VGINFSTFIWFGSKLISNTVYESFDLFLSLGAKDLSCSEADSAMPIMELEHSLYYPQALDTTYVLNLSNPVHIRTFLFFKIHFNITPRYTS